MATRLPNPGGDENTWGNILNAYLLQAHTETGELRSDTVGTSQLQSGTVTGAKLADNTITENKLATAVRDKLNATGAGGATNLSTTTTATTVTVASDTGDDATLPAATPAAAGVLTAADKSKLNAIDSGATANASDAQLRDRSTHTGTQPISTVANLQSTLDSKASQTDLNAKADTADLADVATSGAYSDLSGRPTIPAQFNPIAGANVSLSGTYPNITISSAGEGETVATDLSASTTATTVTVASSTGTDATLPAATTTAAGVLTAADKTKLNNVATNATANATDAQLRDRSTHTGSQAISTVTNLQSTLDGKAATSHTHTIANVTGLQGALDDKANADAVVTSGNSSISGIEYYASENDLPATGVAGVLYVTPSGN